jgi:DNA-binding transcriptional MerR regulator
MDQGAADLHKLYYRIGEVAGIVGVEPHVLRYWETEFRSIRPQKSRKGQRIYSRRDVEKLMRVKDLLYVQGFTIAGARRRLREGGTEPLVAPAPLAPEPAAEAPALAAATMKGAVAAGWAPVTRESDALRATLRDVRAELEALLVELDGGAGVE